MRVIPEPGCLSRRLWLGKGVSFWEHFAGLRRESYVEDLGR
jgi:hypothetical protein